jgi:tRNA modification GTPase
MKAPEPPERTARFTVTGYRSAKVVIVGYGARLAQPGEFTKRAYLNGRIDLTQAEAVVDLIRSKTMVGLEIANQQLRGLLHDELCGMKQKLIGALALIEAHIDFPEEDLEPMSHESLRVWRP